MNEADSEIVLRLLADENYAVTPRMDDADVVLVNTCSIRDNAEQRVYGRLGEFKRLKAEKPGVVIGLLGCMAERLRSKLTGQNSRGVGKAVDIIVGPDEYRKVPELLQKAWHGDRGVAVQLSRVETYDDIVPLRTDGVCAWISVMRGCDKFCSFCVVPFTRGRERSRSQESILREVETLAGRGFREVTLLGQNVNSYRDGDCDFAGLLASVASVDPSLRVRFTTSHPMDMSDTLLGAIASTPNICKYIHLPVQSGSDRILGLMNRSYDTDHYLGLIRKIRERMPEAVISTDIITGFPGETEEDHVLTLELMRTVEYDGAFTFKYSPREQAPSFKMGDTVSDEVKTRRIGEILALQHDITGRKNAACVGGTFEVLVEGRSKKSADQWQGRTDGNRVVIFPEGEFGPGDYILIRVDRANAATLFGTPIRPVRAAGRARIAASA